MSEFHFYLGGKQKCSRQDAGVIGLSISEDGSRWIPSPEAII
jgi:hypothetical protein